MVAAVPEYAGIAQSVEQLICNQQVGGSSPSTSSIKTARYGGIPEWPKGTDCKSAGDAFGGPNPPSPTRKASRMRGFSTLFAFGELYWASPSDIRFASDIGLRPVLEANGISLRQWRNIAFAARQKYHSER